MTATMPSAPDLRECRLYRFWVRHPVTGERVLGYIGETVREPFDRLMEHIARQPWVDTIFGWEVDERSFSGKDAVVRAEKAAVEREKPLYNDQWNGGNRERISLEDAKLQRWARDDARGVPRWRPGSSKTMYRRGWEVPAPAAPMRRPYGAVTSQPARPVRRWKRWQKQVAAWASGWAVLTLAGWIALLYWHVGGLGWRQAGATSAVAAAMLVGWTRLGCPLTKRKWRQAWRRRFRKGRRR